MASRSIYKAGRPLSLPILVPSRLHFVASKLAFSMSASFPMTSGREVTTDVVCIVGEHATSDAPDNATSHFIGYASHQLSPPAMDGKRTISGKRGTLGYKPNPVLSREGDLE